MKKVLLALMAVGVLTSGQAHAMTTGWNLFYKDSTTNQSYYSYVTTSGSMLQGWHYIDGYWYFFSPLDNGGVTVVGMSELVEPNLVILDRGHNINGKVYHFYKDGRMVADTDAINLAGEYVHIDINGNIME